MKYSIDTSAILDGWRRYYSPDVFPDVWSGIDELIDSGHLAATEEVLVELEKRDDEIHAWAKVRKDKFMIPIDERIQERVAAILERHEKLARHNRSGADCGSSAWRWWRAARSSALRGLPAASRSPRYRTSAWISGCHASTCSPSSANSAGVSCGPEPEGEEE